MNERDEVRLRHMRDAANHALAFARGRSEADLDTDVMFAYALSHALQIIGEAASQVTRETRVEYPQIAWDDIIGMRQWLVHGYDRVKTDVLWMTVQKDLSPLVNALNELLPPANPKT
jgi:uncharacterized protein with HEPN domain